MRPVKDKPAKKSSYIKASNFQTVKVSMGATEGNDSNMSTPKAEGGIVMNNGAGVSGLQDINMNFQLIVNKERVVTE